MIVVIHRDDDAEKTREFRHGLADLLESWLRQRLYIDLAGEQAGEEKVASAPEIVKPIFQSVYLFKDGFSKTRVLRHQIAGGANKIIFGDPVG